MAFNLYLDPTTKDIQVDSNFNLQLTDTAGEHLSQKIENQLATFKGEWFLNPELGIPYYQSILKKQANIDEVNNIFLAALLSIDEVEEVLSFTVDYDNSTRDYSLDFTVKTVSGETIEGSV